MGEGLAEDGEQTGEADYLCWLPEYSVGLAIIDAQHRRIFAMINTLYAAMNKPLIGVPIGRVLDEMADYIAFHFNTEKAYLGVMPGFAAHDQEHRQFIAKTKKFTSDYGKISHERLLHDMLIFLAYWLKDHIKGTDKRQFASYLALAGHDRQPTTHKENHG